MKGYCYLRRPWPDGVELGHTRRAGAGRPGKLEQDTGVRVMIASPGACNTQTPPLLTLATNTRRISSPRHMRLECKVS